jgi:hypothetical protein
MRGIGALVSPLRFHRDIFTTESALTDNRMKTMSTTAATDHDVSILARLLGNEGNELPADIARYFLTLGFRPCDKVRMHELAIRNQEGALSNSEREELFAYARTGTVLSILKSKARRVLKTNPKKRTGS